jgi:GWxTD domain-containing protein
LNEKDSLLYSKEMNVSWVDKPMSLSNPKFAYELLELMESEDYLDKIYNEANGEYEKAIWLFWKKYDPDNSTEYNQLMHEFYSRADNALREYSARGEKFGVLTDRAKIYIKYGEPAEVDRYYSDKDEITEIWKYISPNVEFVFVDATGLGNYKLVN